MEDDDDHDPPRPLRDGTRSSIRSRRRSMRSRSILDSLGSDIIGVMSPVSICMFLVVLLVSFLTPHHSTNQQQQQPPPPTTAATLVYQESPSDPPSTKLRGALLNALAFVSLVAAVTFLLLLLYYYNLTPILRGYMRLSAFLVLSSMGGSLLLSLLRRLPLPLDAPSFLLLLLNSSSVGVLAVLSTSSFPILLRQSYMVSLGVIVAAWLTRLPEWTTWTLLLSLALYDLVAVLAPGGPLKLLVELASSRDDDLPAFVYEARPSSPRPPPSIELINLFAFAGSTSTSSDPPPPPPPPPPRNEDTSDTSPLVVRSGGDDNLDRDSDGNEEEVFAVVDEEEEEEEEDRTRGIKLGLGDFVFYSVLVGRAAMYDWMTVYACYLAVVAGLACTLVLLSVFRKALPALPISVALGVAFYFLTRLLLEPLVVGLSTGLLMF